MTSSQYVFEGDRVRVLVRGKSVHSVTGTVRHSSPAALRVQVEDTGRTVELPSQAIVSIELEVWDAGSPSFVDASLPMEVEDILSPFRDLLLNGSGALPRAVMDDQVRDAVALCDSTDLALFDPKARGAVALIRSALTSFVRARSADEFDKMARACDAATEGAKEAEQLEDPALGPVAVAGSTVRRLVDQYWKTRAQDFDPRPRLLSGDSPTRVSMSGTGEIELPVRVRVDSHLAPATDVTVIYDEDGFVGHLGGPPAAARISPGETRTLRTHAVIDHTRAAREFSLQLRAQIQYRTPGGVIQKSPK